MDSTTAPQSSASFPVDAPPSTAPVKLYELVARLADPLQRPGAARDLAFRAGADDLIIFVVDAEIGVLLPAPGFRQTLPDFRRWHAFLEQLVDPSAPQRDTPLIAPLPYPDRDVLTTATGIASVDGSVLVLLGNGPASASVALTIRDVLPVLAAAFRSEQTLLAAQGLAAVARDAAGQAMLLTTSLENARRALQGALAEAEAANKSKDQFLAVLSHELRTPLAPVLTTATALLAGDNLSPELRDALEMIRRNAELEARLIDDLLDLTRVSKGKMPLNLGAVDAHALIRQTLEICQSDVYRKTLSVALDLRATEYHVQADPARLQQVLWNLIKNAVKFTPTSGRLQIVSSNSDAQLRVDVNDSGIGIEPQFIGKVFDAFEQTGEDITRSFGGLGLGLAISKALVEAHGGHLRAASAGKDQGATFSLTLATVPRPTHLPPSQDNAQPTVRAQPLRLMLVEDHRDTAAIMARLLKGLGHHVDTAHSVRASLELAGNQSYDLVLSDLGLPDGSGLDLMRTLREQFGLPGIAISGYGMEEDLRQTRDAGFIAHLTKPVNFQQVQAVLSQFVAGKSGRT